MKDPVPGLVVVQALGLGPTGPASGRVSGHLRTDVICNIGCSAEDGPLDDAGIEYGEIRDLTEAGIAIFRSRIRMTSMWS